MPELNGRYINEAMSFGDLFGPLAPLYGFRQPSVYVISDSEMKAYKQKQAEAEVLELKRLIDHHKTQAERLEEEVLKLETDYQLTSAKDN